MNYPSYTQPDPFEATTCVVYAIELDKSVLQDPKFKEKNPNYINGKPCVYIGMTSLDVGERYTQHLSGINSSRIAKHWGRGLISDLVTPRKPTLRRWAIKQERSTARQLRASGYGVWQA